MLLLWMCRLHVSEHALHFKHVSEGLLVVLVSRLPSFPSFLLRLPSGSGKLVGPKKPNPKQKREYAVEKRKQHFKHVSEGHRGGSIVGRISAKKPP